MAIKAVVQLSNAVIGDDVSNVYTLDLLSDPYTGAQNTTNWFSNNHKATFPTGVRAVDGNSYSISGTVVTITFLVAPSSTANSSYQFNLLF